MTAATLRSCGAVPFGGGTDALLLQIVGDALRGVRHLCVLITRAVQTNHQTVAGQLVAAHTLNGGYFFDANSVSEAACQRQDDEQ